MCKSRHANSRKYRLYLGYLFFFDFQLLELRLAALVQVADKAAHLDQRILEAGLGDVLLLV